MSESIISVIMDRISVASEISPIAVFKSTSSKKDSDFPKLNAVFANTVQTQFLIKNELGEFIGVFTKNDDKEKVKSTLGLAAA
ncbi:MAG: hypothetical protein WBI40_07465 [Methylococcaceae bacterium]